LLTSLNYYNTIDSGSGKAGAIDTNAYSVALALTSGAHTLTFAHQNINGDTPFDYLAISGDSGNLRNGGSYNGQDSIWLANSSQYADFNAPGEKSYKLQYDLDASTLGVPGLSFMASYVKGTGGDGSNADVNGAYAGYADMHDGHEWERDIQVAYVVQEGPAKDLSFTVSQATYRGNGDARINTGDNADEIQVITSYPLNIL
jgi:imipenem/basic amino acid-specific outer membrane pore